jgi:DNA-binding transcriptional regulator YiaG
MILYSSLVIDDELAEREGPFQVAADTQGNRRFGALMKNLRERSGLSPQSLAEQASVHVSFVRGIERGVQAPSVTSARKLLACVKEQHRIKWMDGGACDLLIQDMATDRDVAFRFAAKVKGQNRRINVDPALTVGTLLKVLEGLPMIDPATPAVDVLKLVEGMWRIDAQLAGIGRSHAEVAGKGDDGQVQRSEPADDARLGKLVRLIASVDDELLYRLESLLQEALQLPEGPPQP